MQTEKAKKGAQGLGLAILMALMTAAALPQAARAHPHVWVTVETRVVFDDGGAITGFRHKWIFDEFYTAFALQGMDVNGDGIYDEQELEPLARTNIESLNEFDYFTFAWLGEEALPRRDPVDYRLEHRDGLLILDFTLPLVQPVPSSQAGRFRFKVYDPSFFVSFSLAGDKPVQLAGAAPAGCTTTIGDAPMASAGVQTLGEAFFDSLDASMDWGAQFAQEVALRCNHG